VATRTFLGRAAPVPQRSTLTLGGTWLETETLTMTINGKSLVLTIGGTVTTTVILDNILVMLTGSGSFGTGYSAIGSGATVGEFKQLTFEKTSATVLTITGAADGRPFTLATTESSTSGTVSDATVSGTGTGPHHANNVDNWSADTLPVTGDDIVLDGLSTSALKYALDGLAIQPNSIVQTSDYTGEIGLPKVNTDNPSYPYDEYLVDALTFADDANTNTTTCTIGSGNGPGSPRTKINFADCTGVTINVQRTGQSAETGIPALLLQFSDSATILNVNRGDVGVAFYEGEDGHLATLRVGYIDNPAGDANVVLGKDADIADATITVSGGTLTTNSANGSGTVTMLGGIVTVNAGAYASIVIDAGTCYYQSPGTLASAIIGSDATLDFSRDLQTRIVSACAIHNRGTIRDPNRTVTWTTDIDIVRCSLLEVTLDIGTHLSVGVGDI
jgi:hypothetical protein